MKKIIALCCLLVITACGIRAGNHDIWPERNKFVEDFFTYPITFYNGMQPIKTELITERNFPANKVLSAQVGYSVVDTKVYRKINYAQEMLRAPAKGGLSSGTMPVIYERGQMLPLLGEIVIDKERYALIPAKEEGFVVLVDGRGRPYRRMGQIRGDRLVLLTTEFVPYPEGFLFEAATETKTVQTSPIKGYDIKYGGLQANNMIFVFYQYDAPSNDGRHDSGEFEVLSYPKTAKMISIKGVGLRILNVRKDAVEYMILPK